MAFVAPPHHLPFHDAGETYVDAHQHHHHPFANHSSMPHVPQHMPCDIKPRLTKEQHDILEAHYQKQQKPNTNTKKGFAETLGVPLDKVNNWFQNRRAKSKQDAKKQAGAFNLFAQPQQSSAPATTYSSDSATTSPAFSSADYFSMMQHCTSDDNLPNGLPMSSMPQFDDPENALHISSDGNDHAQYGNTMGHHLHPDMFDSPQELNRRTLTQEQFDAFAQNGGMMRSGHFEALHDGFSGDSDVLHQVFPDMHDDFKSQDAFVFPSSIGDPMSSNDSSIPSTISEQSMFSSSSVVPDQASVSTASSEWGESRSSSMSMPQNPDEPFQQVPASQQAPSATTSQWQPGQSVPIDPTALQQQFREAAQRQRSLQQQVPQQEQPLAWPADEAFVRRDSQNGAMLAQQMNSFGLQTPQPPQSPTFKTPAPPGQSTASIAVRRQRPKPQPLGMAAMRSQSYNGTSQPGSPNHQQQAQFSAPGQQLRRIRSSNVINGVAQGRVMKSVPGSAQRSPLNWTFADAATANSPKIMRHASSSSVGNLVPPTPMSPNEAAAARQDQSRPQFQSWQSASGHFSRQDSISETDAEHNIQLMPPQQPVTSPPHTPVYQHHPQQQYAQARMVNSFVTENTPPQSAPAVQTSFPANAFVVPQQQQQQQQQQHQPHHAPSTSQPQPQPMPMYIPHQQHMQQQHFMSTSVPEQGFQVPAHYGPPQHYIIPVPEGGSQMPMHFASGGVPVVNAQGNITLAYPPPVQQMQFIQHTPPQMQGQQAPPHMHTPPQGGQQFSFVTTSGTSPGGELTSQFDKPSQPASDFYVHEYSPPRDLKQATGPRKPTVDNGPKNYTFANQGPEHFEKERGKKGDKSASASESPSSATS